MRLAVIPELISCVKQRHLEASCTKFCTAPQGGVPHKSSEFGVDRPLQSEDMTSVSITSVLREYSLAYSRKSFLRIDLGSTSQYDVCPEMIHAKFGVDWTCGFGGVNSERLVSFRDVAREKFRRKWAWPIPRDSAGSPERVDIKFFHIRLRRREFQA